MDHVDRFYATIERCPVDHPASWLGIPFPSALPGLFKQYKVSNFKELKKKVGDDVWNIDIPYDDPPANHVACAFNFAPDRQRDYENRTLTDRGYFASVEDLAAVDDFDWPDPARHIEPDACKQVVEDVPDGYPILGVAWSAHFQDLLAAFGMERAFIKMFKEPDLVHAVSNKIVSFYLKANQIFYKSTKGRLDAVLIGNDFGGQHGLMLSPEMIREFAIPGSRLLIEQAKQHGLKVFYHSCGSMLEIIPNLIEMGVDVLHPIQALAHGMDAQNLKDKFSSKISFCGGIDAQHLLVFGNVDEIRATVQKIRKIFPTGLIISPSHEAILPTIPPANIQALFDANGES